MRRKSGRARALGVTRPKRLDSLPDLPAIGEAVPASRGERFAQQGRRVASAAK